MTSMSKYVYIDNVDDIVTKHNNIYIIETIRLKLVDVKASIYLDFDKVLVLVSEYQNIKICLKKVMFQIDLKKFLWVKEVENVLPWTNVISDPNREEIIKTFYKKDLQKTNQKQFDVKKVIKRNDDKLYVKMEGWDNSFNSWIDKKYTI